MNFTELIDLAGERLGGRALSANDDFFAPKENLTRAAKAVFIEDKYTPRGKWMDGWESRRRRTPGHDWCVVKLGLRGVVRGVDVDTSFFTGNYPEFCALEARDGASAEWTEILPRSPLKGSAHNFFPIPSLRPWTHLRLNIFPDGGVARLRAYGDVVPNWANNPKRGLIDLAAVENAGLAIAQSDMHYGKATNMLMPGRAKNMGDGWETKRRRGPGHDWCIIKLGASGIIEKVELDTNHFKGNYPDTFTLEGIYAPDADPTQLSTSGNWLPLIEKTKLKAHKRHFFKLNGRDSKPLTHVRLNIFPDGGVSRLRLHGRPALP